MTGAMVAVTLGTIGVVRDSGVAAQQRAEMHNMQLVGFSDLQARSAYLSLNVDSDAEAERIFSALSDGGEVFMPMQETFFATRFAQLRDRFGINWMILHERQMPSRP